MLCTEFFDVYGRCYVQLLYIKQLEFHNLSFYDSVKLTYEIKDI